MFVVVVVGGMGSLAGAFVASLLIGLLQTFAVALDYSLADVLGRIGVAPRRRRAARRSVKLTIAQIAPILPYLLLVLILIFRPKGLLGHARDMSMDASRTRAGASRARSPARRARFGRWRRLGRLALLLLVAAADLPSSSRARRC